MLKNKHLTDVFFVVSHDGRHYVPPLALFFHERRKVYVQYMFVDYVLNHHNAYLSNLLTAQMIQSDYLKVTDSLEKNQKCFLV